jgi:hypothetical protein
MQGEKASKGLRPFPPQPFGRYTLLAPLASGGMGEVFLGRLEGAQGFEKLVVIKKILPQLAQEQDFVDRFVTEAKVLVKLHHGSVAQVLDMGTIDGDYYIALEFVDGKDLRKVAARCRERGHTVPLGLTLFVMMRVLDALAYAHRKKGDDDRDLDLVHRDVSPQNVLVSYEGEVKVIDFGLAKSSLSLGRTNPSVILGKFFYMSPEQAKHGKVDRRSDLYAAAICLYELVAGKNPFDGLPQGELMNRVANPRIEPLSLAMPGAPASVDQLVMRALSPDPKDRFSTAEEMRGRVMAAMLELDPAAGPESLAHFMRAVFSGEHAQERRIFQGLRDAAVSARNSDARTGVMPALRLADSEPATTGAPRPSATAATAETHVGPRSAFTEPLAAETPLLSAEPLRDEMPAPQLPDGRLDETTRPATMPERDGLPPIAPSLRTTGEFTLPAPLRTDPARTALDPATLRPFEPQPAPRLAPPTDLALDDPQEFLPPPDDAEAEDELPVIAAEPARALTPPEPVRAAAPRSVPSAPRPVRPAVVSSPGLPRVMVAPDLHQETAGRIETASTRPLLGAAPRGRPGERSAARGVARPAAASLTPAPGERSRPPPVVIDGPAQVAPAPRWSSSRTSVFIGLGIGAGLVLLALVVMLIWNLTH